MKFYNLKDILNKKSHYNVIFGERSNGKTYALLRHGLLQWEKTGEQLAYIRRWADDIKKVRMSTVFNALVANGEVSKITKGKFTDITFSNGRFYLAVKDDKGNFIYSDSDVLGFVFALTEMERTKSTSYPKVTTIIYDEFLTNGTYLDDEFIMFTNIISTIARQRDNLKIFMLGNTVNKYCPYFEEMGLNRISQQIQGSIDTYHYGDSGLSVSVEYCGNLNAKGKPSDKLFAFNNPKLEMITDGTWQLGLYPHLPEKFKPKEILMTFFIQFSGDTLQCEIVQKRDMSFIFIHKKTSDIKNPDNDLIYSLDFTPKINYNRNLLKPRNKTQEKILYFFKNDLVFYQNNAIGNTVSNYLKLCRR